MRYPIQIRETQGAKRLIVPLLSRHPRCFGSFEAFIDTGSPRTIISAVDAEKLMIPFNSLNETQPIIGFGKGNVPTLAIDKFNLVMRASDGQSKQIVMPVVITDVSKMRKRDQQILDHARTIPSLIGMDFLERNKFKLFVDLEKNEAYFED